MMTCMSTRHRRPAASALLLSYWLAPPGLARARQAPEVGATSRPAPLAAAPDPGNKQYVHYFASRDSASTTHNWREWPSGTRTVQIAGKRVVFDAADESRLMARVNRHQDIKRLDVYAETLIVRLPVVLPGTEVRIHAEELRFEDVNGERSLIDTTPLAPPAMDQASIPGGPGLPGGSVHVHVKRLFSQQDRYPRFRMNGGAGQKGGPGAHGVNGESAVAFAAAQPSLLQCARDHGISAGERYGQPRPGPISLQDLESRAIDLEATPPTSGAAATPGGKPGDGGDAGSLFASLPGLAPYAEMEGGKAGAAAGYYRGGSAGTPSPAFKLASARCFRYFKLGPPSISWKRLIVPSVERIDAGAGAGVDSPHADRPRGASGAAHEEGNAFTWFHPHAVAVTVAFAEDAYANDFRDLAGAELRKLAETLDAYRADPAWSELSEDDRVLFEQQELRVKTLLAQLESGEDFFGNPLGWVPPLSLEANMLLFEQEVGWAIRTIFLADWITTKDVEQRHKVAALAETRRLLQERITHLEEELDAASSRLPAARLEAENAAVRLAHLTSEVKAAERALAARAAQNVEERHKLPFWKKGLRMVASVARLVPVAQPLLGGGAGGVLDVVARIDSDAPWETLDQLAEFSTNLSARIDKWKAKAKAARDKKDDEKPEEKATKGSLTRSVGEVNEAVLPLLEELKKTKDLLKQAQVPKEEVAQELEKLQKQDPAFVRLAALAAEVAGEREASAARSVGILETIERAAARIDEHYLQIAQLLPELEGAAAAALSQRAELALNDMRQQAVQRLRKYQYLLARAFEYRTLSKYPGDLTLVNLFREMVALVNASADGVAKAAEYENLFILYRNELSAIVDLMVRRYNGGAGQYRTDRLVDLTADQLASLNNGGLATLDFWEQNSFPQTEEHTEEDVRVVGLEVVNLQFAGAAPGDTSVLDVVIEHGGTSRIWYDGLVHVFKHYNKLTQAPLRWITRYQNGVLKPHRPSPSDESLIRSLLNGRSVDIDLFARPSAWARFFVRTSVHDPEGRSFPLAAVRLRIQYDYRPAPSLFRWQDHREGQNRQVAGIYTSRLRRDPGADELRSGRELLDVGYSVPALTAVVDRTYQEERLGAWVDDVYRELCSREPTAAERGWWAKELMNGRPEQQVREYVKLITGMFDEMYHRPPTFDELKRCTRLLDDGVPV